MSNEHLTKAKEQTVFTVSVDNVGITLTEEGRPIREAIYMAAMMGQFKDDHIEEVTLPSGEYSVHLDFVCTKREKQEDAEDDKKESSE